MKKSMLMAVELATGNAVDFVVMGAIAQRNKKILDNSRRFLHIQITERDKICL